MLAQKFKTGTKTTLNATLPLNLTQDPSPNTPRTRLPLRTLHLGNLTRLARRPNSLGIPRQLIILFPLPFHDNHRRLRLRPTATTTMRVSFMPSQDIQPSKPLPTDPTRIRPLLGMYRPDMARKMLSTMIAASTSGTLVESMFLATYVLANYHCIMFS
ncbi:hypothetical protein CFIO01_03531 [Colletotrichum fioriniae PJ7]|uniref:Uncharacterized protein n=1 Tax=Colletotrichum fioriniae PJ7 TaxID=1445577 RepID=A0A010RV29_9PEZI|nr:hypothetical protein CFIO01_03531 [Colletotrichum fioriniae PJ7]